MTAFPPMPLLSITSPATIEKCKKLALCSTDIFICSYPKSGTTWTQHIILTLLLADMRCRRKTSDPNNDDDDVGIDCYEHVSEYAPFFEIDAHWDQSEEKNNNDSSLLVDTVRDKHDKLGRRVFNTHLRWDMLPKNRAAMEDRRQAPSMTTSITTTTSVEEHRSNEQHSSSTTMPACGKFIYIVRNLPDVCASFYHHLSNQKEGTYNHDFTTFARDWMDGTMPFGSPIHHLLSFAEGFSINQYCKDDMNIDNYSSNYDNNDADDSTTTPPRQNGRPLLLLSYERMKTNMLEEVLRIIDFLNLDAIPIETLKKEILPTFTFHYMKERSTMFQPKSVTWLNGFQFLRRGIVGDGKRLMMETPAIHQNENNDHEDNCGSGKDMSLLTMFQDWLNDEEYQLRITNYGLDLDTAKRFLAREDLRRGISFVPIVPALL